MSDSAAVPIRLKDVRPAKENSRSGEADAATANSSGPRKLVRPRLPEGLLPGRRPERVATPLYTTPSRERGAMAAESSHAETFYFQKQLQSQTLMVFVLDDGQQIEGVIEWYDRNCIKVKHGHRTLIYKSSIKYLFKAAERLTGSLL